MPVIEVSAYYLQCDGPAAVPWEDHCAAKYSLSYDKEELEKTSIADGWGAEGRKRFCPQHRAVAPAEKPARKSRVASGAPADAEDQ